LLDLRLRQCDEAAVRVLVGQPLEELNRAELVALLSKAVERVLGERACLPERVVGIPVCAVLADEGPVSSETSDAADVATRISC
jgi:hypothetical protein